MTLETKKTLCPFCSYGCELGLKLDEFGNCGVEYPKDTFNAGRICPRGSATALLLNHPRRLTQPMKGSKYITWEKAAKDLVKMITVPEKVAVTFDRNITGEEYSAVVELCQSLGVENCASTYFEPESLINGPVDQDIPFELDHLNGQPVIVVVGDIFNQSPMISKAVIAWRLKSRNNRLVVVDSIRSHTAAFATDFVKVNTGTEPLALLALGESRGLSPRGSEITGVPGDLAVSISRVLKDAGRGMMFVTTSFGRYYDDLLFAQSIRQVAAYNNLRVIPFYESAAYAGNVGFGSILDKIKARKIKNLICFGELFPRYYPQLARELRGIGVILAATMRCDLNTALPAALLIEKSGSIRTSFGIKHLNGAIEPPSGVKNITEIIGLFSKPSGKSAAWTRKVNKIDMKNRADQLADRFMARKKRKKNQLQLIGAKSAFHYLGLLEDETVCMNPVDCDELKIKPLDFVQVESKHAKRTLRVNCSARVDPGTVSVPAETDLTRGFFDYIVDEDEIRFLPTEVEVWRKE